MHTALGSPAERMRGYYERRAKQGKEQPPEDWAAVERQVAELLTRHRINATPPSGSLRPEAQPDGSFLIPAEQIEAARAFVDRYHVNALPILHPRTAVKDPEAEKERLHAWLRAWDRAAKELDRPQVLFYTYLRDGIEDYELLAILERLGRRGEAEGIVLPLAASWFEWNPNPADYQTARSRLAQQILAAAEK